MEMALSKPLKSLVRLPRFGARILRRSACLSLHRFRTGPQPLRAQRVRFLRAAGKDLAERQHCPDQDYSWLEIARYNGQFFISFPPFPAVVMIPFVLVFGEQTPSMFIVFALFMASYVVGYALARRHGYSDALSACLGAFLVLGCNMLEASHYGGVWNMAQMMAFLLTLLSFWYISSKNRRHWYASLICLALAVGCRPFQLVYAPVLLCMLYGRLWEEKPEINGIWPAIRAMLPFAAAPAAILLGYAAYNFVRFGDIFEFGHNYLPEFTDSVYGQFSVHYMRENMANILRLPYFQEAMLVFPIFSGFAFFIANPIYLIWGERALVTAVRRRLILDEGLLLAAFFVHFALLLMHKSFGGWQFGTRYLCDLIPAMYFFIVSQRHRVGMGTAAVMIFAVVFNIYGSVVFHVLS